jgi:hypothetical protein
VGRFAIPCVDGADLCPEILQAVSDSCSRPRRGQPGMVTIVSLAADFPGELGPKAAAGANPPVVAGLHSNRSPMVDTLLSAPLRNAAVRTLHAHPSLLDLRHSSNVAVEVRGVNDPALLAQIANSMPHLFHHLVGSWAVDARPADDRGRWLLALHGAFGRHVWTFSATLNELPEAITARISGFIRAAAAAYRPPYVH